MIVTLELPWPPTVNHYWGQRIVMQRGRKPFVMMYHTERAKQFICAVGAAMLFHDIQPFPKDCRLSVRVALHPPTRRKCDVDNFQKALLDALTANGLWEDDSQIDELHIRRGEIVPDGAAIVEVMDVLNGGVR